MQKNVLICVLGICTFFLLIFAAHSQTSLDTPYAKRITDAQYADPLFATRGPIMVRHTPGQLNPGAYCT